ncbi:MAG: hypothetical protein JSR72_03555 [Proteobacteria bacterium]|nr:hypothetical protein [Pseudomonadota bacterium]
MNKTVLQAAAAAAACLLLAACGGPSDADVAQAVGKSQSEITNVSCTEASGQPGYVCSFTYLGNVLTRRFIKTGSGYQLVN